MSESKSRPLKISLSKTDLNGKYGDDVEFTADLSTVKDVITGAVGAIGPENCLKLGGGAAAATALYVLVRSIRKNWPWLQTTNVEKDVLEVSVPPKREKQFTELMETKVLEQRLVEDFKNLKINLEGILGEETFDQCGEDVLKLLKDIRIKSIGQNVSDLPKDLIAGKVFRGKVDQKIINRHELIAVKNPKGSVIGMLADRGADVKQEIRGGGDMMVLGYEGDDFKRVVDVHKHLAGGDIPVKIYVKQTGKTFERKFKPTTIIDEVSLALKKEEKEFYDLFRDGKTLDGEMTLAQASQTGSTVNWKTKALSTQLAALHGGTAAVPGISALDDVAPGGIMKGKKHERISLVTKGHTSGGTEKDLNALQGEIAKAIPDNELWPLKVQHRSRNADKKIGPEGGHLSLDECNFSIPPYSLFETQNLSIFMSMRFQNLFLPADRTPISPYVGVNFHGKLRHPVKIRVPTWFRPSKDSEYSIKIYKRYRDEENKFAWRELQNKVEVHDNIIEFEVDHFCGFIGLIPDWLWGNGQMKLTHGLFHRNRNFRSVACYRWPKYLFKEADDELRDMGFKKIYHANFIMKNKQKVPIKMECNDVDLHKFDPPQYLLTPSDIKNNDTVPLSFLLHHLKEPKDEVDIKYTVDDRSAPLNVKLPAIKGHGTDDAVKPVKSAHDVLMKPFGETAASGLPKNMVAGSFVGGTRKVKESGKRTSIFVRGNGIATAEIIAKGGVVDGELHNESVLVAQDYDADEAVKLAKHFHGNAIKVKIRGEMFSVTFEDNFDPTMTIEEVCETIQKQEKLAKKITLTRKVGELTDEMVLAEAERKGSLVTLQAKFFDERN